MVVVLSELSEDIPLREELPRMFLSICDGVDFLMKRGNRCFDEKAFICRYLYTSKAKFFAMQSHPHWAH